MAPVSEPVVYTLEDAHRLLALPADHPDAPQRPLRDQLKTMVFECIYSGKCTHDA